MVVITVFFVLYFILLVIFLAGWKRAMHLQVSADSGREVLISVVVAVRNEALTIFSLLEDLAAQDYKKYEIIVVNDHSDDDTAWVVSRFGLQNLKLLQSKGDGKKAALATGVRQAKGSIIVTTDADCSVPPGWLKSVQARFKNPAAMMVFGGVRMEGEDTFADSLQALEFSSLIGAAASTAALGFPSLCNGANLAYRKKVFMEVQGYQGNLQTPSGDDEFLMRKVMRRYKGGIHFNNDPGAVVTTRTQPDARRFLNQRIRWASKWRFNSDNFAKALALFVVLLQVTFIVNWFLIPTPFILQALFLVAIKVILEAAFLLQVCRLLRTRWNWLAFFGLQIAYPLYVVAVATASFFVPFYWKNRVFKPEWPYWLRRGWIFSFPAVLLFNFYL